MTTQTWPPILLVGGGKMGGALLQGWRDSGLTQAVVVDPGGDAAKLNGPGVTVVASAAQIPAGFMPQAVVLAVKPQMAPAVLPEYERFPDAVFLSIMAGRCLHGLAQALPGPVVRAMPNTPAAIRQGISVACAGPGVSDTQRDLCDRLLRAAGAVEWVTDEALLDPVTAVSGSGPAYVFLLAELMEQAGIAQGLPPALARSLARQTVAGAAALLASSGQDAAALRQAVTSPNGTTQAALQVLMQPDAWPATMNRAIAAAATRSRELAE